MISKESGRNTTTPFLFCRAIVYKYIIATVEKIQPKRNFTDPVWIKKNDSISAVKRLDEKISVVRKKKRSEVHKRIKSPFVKYGIFLIR
jgi:hypothetical protein